MMFWFWGLSAVLCVVVVLVLLVPLSRSPRVLFSLLRTTSYRERPYAHERTKSLKSLSDQETVPLSTEIDPLRNLENHTTDHTVSSSSHFLSWTLIVVVPLTAFLMYILLGRPDLPDHPYKPTVIPPLVQEALESLNDHLRRHPTDFEDWRLLAQAYSRLGRTTESLNAWRKAVDYASDSKIPEIMSEFGRTLVWVNRGRVLSAARQIFEIVLTHDPSDPYARFFLGLAFAQADNLEEAVTRWTEIIVSSPADAVWLPMVRGTLVQALQQLGRSDEPIPSPLPAVIPQILDFSLLQGEQTLDVTIPEMVEELETRLKTDTEDVEGWLFLARSYQVLGQTEKQLHALMQAFTYAPDNLQVLLAYGFFLFENRPLEEAFSAPLPEIMQRALRLSPNHPEVLRVLGLNAVQEGRHVQARDLWLKALLQFSPQSDSYTRIEELLNTLSNL